MERETYLNGRRVELIKSVISEMPIHKFYIYWWPKSLINIMERWMCNFTWIGDVDSSKKKNYVSWEEVYKPKIEGGPGIQRLRDVNKEPFRKLVLQIKYGNSVMSHFFVQDLLIGKGL